MSRGTREGELLHRLAWMRGHGHSTDAALAGAVFDGDITEAEAESLASKAGWTEVVLFVNDREYDLRGFDGSSTDAALVIAEFSAEFAGEPDKASVAVFRHDHPMNAKCDPAACDGQRVWSNGVTEIPTQ